MPTPAVMEPFRNTPSKLPRFLAYAEKEYGMTDVMAYRFALEGQKIGPDVIGRISDDTLAGLNIPIGDIRRLKDCAAIWMNSDDAKKQSTPNDGADAGVNLIRFEKKMEGWIWCAYSFRHRDR
ncbi:hypothetical protein K435DRAFT_886815 [Dendrothele bispora CBS 962.96]|uniref:SAM domain-containing protein n=1 Tax=Dendrothele bispora (strain CBS 962.96) TaxID=1314807 RepID=A0A4S8KSN0_DENBC|nr:hypothetical protein K435DRAFT_886815 [Dendrothele bispora CBS 962.96]